MRAGIMRRTTILLGLVLSAFVPTARSEEIRVVAVSAVKETYLELIPEFEKTTGHNVITIWSGTGELLKRVKTGEAFDLAIAGTDALQDLVNGGRLAPGSRVDFAKSGVGVAVRAGSPKFDIQSSEAVKHALLSARSIGYSTGPSGLYLQGLFQRMGIAEQVKPKLKIPPTGMSVGEFVARGDAEIGFQQVSELIHVKGVDFLGPLPDDIQQMTIFSTGISTNAKSPSAAEALSHFLASPAAAPVILKNGLEPG